MFLYMFAKACAFDTQLCTALHDLTLLKPEHVELSESCSPPVVIGEPLLQGWLLLEGNCIQHSIMLEDSALTSFVMAEALGDVSKHRAHAIDLREQALNVNSYQR